jgi:chromosome segregation ATPase
VLYLAEVKKQTKGLISGLKTELKLLAFQRDDQAWTTVTNEEIVSCDYVNSVGEGALVFINLNNNREVQGSPELGGTRIVKILQYFSRILEKAREEQENIDTWKDSLTYQSQELKKRREQLESQFEEIVQREEELADIEEKRREIEEAWQKLAENQQQIQNLNPNNFLGEQRIAKLKELINSFASIFQETNSLPEKFKIMFRTIDTQQEYLQQEWHNLQKRRNEANQKANQLEQLNSQLKEKRKELSSVQKTIEQAKIEFKKQQIDLQNKQRILGIINVNLQSNLELRSNLLKSIKSFKNEQKEYKNPVENIESLESLSLAELQEEVNKLEQELQKWTFIVNGQEEELNMEVESVVELEQRLNEVEESEKERIRQELADAQERKKMMEETIEGQKATLEERRDVLAQYQDLLEHIQSFQGTFAVLETQYNSLQQEKERLEPDINSFRLNLGSIQELIDQQSNTNQQRENELERELENWQYLQRESALIQAQVEVSEQILQPWQKAVNEIQEKLNQIENSLNHIQGDNGLFNEFEQIFNSFGN